MVIVRFLLLLNRCTMVENRILKITDDLENLGPIGSNKDGLIRFFKGRRTGNSLSAVEVFFISSASDEWYTNFEKEINKLTEVSGERHAKLPRFISSGFTGGSFPF